MTPNLRASPCLLGDPALADEPDFKTNAGRVTHRDRLIPRMLPLTQKFTRDDLLKKLEAAGVPGGPINDLADVFADPQVNHRKMRVDLPDAAAKGGAIPGVRTPIMIDGVADACGSPLARARPAHRRNPARDRRSLKTVELPSVPARFQVQQNGCALARAALYQSATRRLRMSNVIEKQIELKAPVSRVWRALTDHNEFGEWFRVKLENPFVPGEVCAAAFSIRALST